MEIILSFSITSIIIYTSFQRPWPLAPDIKNFSFVYQCLYYLYKYILFVCSSQVIGFKILYIYNTLQLEYHHLLSGVQSPESRSVLPTILLVDNKLNLVEFSISTLLGSDNKINKSCPNIQLHHQFNSRKHTIEAFCLTSQTLIDLDASMINIKET